MNFRPYCCFETGCASYLFGCAGLGRCAVVEAHLEDLEAYVAFAAAGGKPSSTIAFEKRWNPLLSLSREAFIDALADVPPKPAAMAQLLRQNRGRAEVES